MNISGSKKINEEGYLAWVNTEKTIHRWVAFKYIYKEGYKSGEYTKRFREYQVHHIDGNKLNNHMSNLQIVTGEEHQKIHGFKFKS